jgi:hypothetical protein
MFLLCTYVDSERWTSAIEPLLYPSGVTFYRPFSYRREYFLPEQLADQLADPSQVRSLLRTPSWNDAIFGVRFRVNSDPDFRPFFVPLRRIKLISSERADELNIRFNLGDFVEPGPLQNGQRHLPRLDLTPVVRDVGDLKLFLQLSEPQRQETRAWSFARSFPHEFWDAFVNSLSGVVRQQLKDTVILRLEGLRLRGQNAPLAPEEIDHERSTKGYRLRQGTTYDVQLYYRRLVEKGTNAPPVEHCFTLTNPAEEVQASRKSVRIMGNYRAEEIWIHPLVGKPGPIELAFEPAKSEEPAQIVDQAISKMIGLKIPVLAKTKLLTVPRAVNLVLSLLSVAAILYSLRLYFYASPSDSTKRILELFIAAFASLAITSLKDLFIQKH